MKNKNTFFKAFDYVYKTIKFFTLLKNEKNAL